MLVSTPSGRRSGRCRRGRARSGSLSSSPAVPAPLALGRPGRRYFSRLGPGSRECSGARCRPDARDRRPGLGHLAGPAFNLGVRDRTLRGLLVRFDSRCARSRGFCALDEEFFEEGRVARVGFEHGEGDVTEEGDQTDTKTGELVYETSALSVPNVTP